MQSKSLLSRGCNRIFAAGERGRDMSESMRMPTTRVLGTLVAAVLISAPGLAAQTGSVTGRVTDAQTGAVIPAVQVFIASLNMGALSQANGQYVIQRVPAGTHTLTVVRIGYRTADVEITVGGGQTLDQNFSLAEGALPLNRVIVRQWRPGWFVEAMEELGRVTEPFSPFEVRAIRQR